MSGERRARRILSDFVRGVAEPSVLADLGIRATRSGDGLIVEVPPGVPSIRPSIRDLATGLLAWNRRGSEALQSWAALVLAVDEIDLASLQAWPDGEAVLDSLWDAAAGRTLREPALGFAQARVGEGHSSGADPSRETLTAAGIVGREVQAIEHEADGDTESAYVRFADGGVVEVRAVETGDFGGPAWPWHLALAPPADPLPEMVVTVEVRGRVEEILLYSDPDEVERRMELRLAGGASIWLESVGGDFVRASRTGPGETLGWRVSRAFP